MSMATERSDLAAILEKTALLSSLVPFGVQSLAARTVLRHFKNGELLFSEDEPCHGLHIVARGKVRIFKTSVKRARASAGYEPCGRIGGGVAGV